MTEQAETGYSKAEHAAHIEHLTVRRTGFRLDDLSLTIPRGTAIGLVGPNGAGKTTTLRSLLGLLIPDEGTVTIFGEPAGSPEVLARTGVALDEPAAAPEWKVGTIGRRLAPFYPRWNQDQFDNLLDRLSVPQDQRVSELSRGEGVKLSVATALAQQPELLILDEPSSGLDPASRRMIGDLLREFMTDPNHTVLFSTHITTDLVGLADALIILVEGKIAYQGGLEDLSEEFAVARGSGEVPTAPMMGVQHAGSQWSALIHMRDSIGFGPEVVIDAASIDDVVIHLGTQHTEVPA